ncbi:MAG: hypothetical protein JNL58_04030 [Planctomyces sp.]|nr:hypothetical protein [Planctomyces sp.]
MENQQCSGSEAVPASVVTSSPHVVDPLAAVGCSTLCGGQSTRFRRWGVTAVCVTLLAGSGLLLKTASGAKEPELRSVPDAFVEASCLEGAQEKSAGQIEVVAAAAMPYLTSVDRVSGDEESSGEDSSREDAGDEESSDEEAGNAGKSKAKGKTPAKQKPTAKDKASDTKKSDSEDAEDSESKKPSTPKKSNLPSPNRRLPAGYSALELTDEQKEQIFAIRDSKQKKLDSLENALSEFRAAMELEFEEVLTSSQKKQLAENRGMSRKNESAEKSSGKGKSRS